jgi:hypothetical protein
MLPKPKNRINKRKLISLTGWKGFKEQLIEDECLYLEYSPEDEDEVRLVRIATIRDFRLINKLDGEQIIGIWAIRTE